VSNYAWAAQRGIRSQGGFPKVAYLDGFAGLDQYEGGEDGSPIIALKAALDHSARITGQVIFVFVEEKQDRAELCGDSDRQKARG
jgi:three-Cys-motif partner protein